MGLDYFLKLLFNSLDNNTNCYNVGAFDIKYYFPSFFGSAVLPSGYVFGWVIASQNIIKSKGCVKSELSLQTSTKGGSDNKID